MLSQDSQTQVTPTTTEGRTEDHTGMTMMIDYKQSPILVQ